MSVAIRALRHALCRIGKGELAMRLTVWKRALHQSRACHLRDVQAKLVDTRHAHSNHQQELGVQAMRHALWGLVRGELGMRVHGWRIHVKDSSSQRHSAVVASVIATERDSRKRQALREMEQALSRRMKGELAMRVVVWKGSRRCDVDRAQRELVGRLRVEERSGRQRAAMGHLRQSVSRMLRGEIGMRLGMWRREVHRHVAQCSAVAVAEVLMQEADSKKSRGVRGLQQVLARMLLGEMGMRVLVWKVAWQLKRRLLEEQALALRVQGIELGSQKAAAVRGLRQVLARMVKGEIGMRVAVWRAAWMLQHAHMEGKQQAELIDLETTWKVAAIRELKQAMARMLRGQVGLRILVWRNAARDFLARQHKIAVAHLAEMSVAIRALRHALCRIGKGELAMRLTVWKRALHQSRACHLRDVQAKLVDTRHAHSNHQQELGVQAMRHALWGLVRGELGMRVHGWRIHVKDSSSQRHSAVVASVIATERDSRKRQALREMEQALSRRMKGELAMRVVVWKGSRRCDVDRAQRELVGRLRVEERSGRQRAAMGHLRQSVSRMLRGEIGMRLGMWRREVHRHVAQCSAVAVAEVLMQEADSKKSRGVRGLQQVLARMLLGEMGMRCLLYTSPSPRDRTRSRMPSSA
eukprot:TRINITY_DN38316_c0_g1_i1.p1 TRINITY_DN38316_c0_g1~~TRINITY_DN38316_c0_g1_i1.p1  ORF type:complete len:639 (-),score=99.74 TRINITY_DN38316_c0_g1_i1:26-1942(-)